jgi:hypothetical protein
MADETEFDAGPGELSVLPAGHDAWVLGDEDVVLIDWRRPALRRGVTRG